MKNYHTEKFVVDDTKIDFNNIVPITEMFRMIEVATFNHSNIIGLDHKSMQEKSNAFWVVTKMKLVLKDNVKTGEKIRVTTWTHELGKIRALRDCVINSNNKIKAKVTAEWCCLDFDTRKIRKLDSIVYPNLEMEKTDNLNIMFTNLRENVDNKHFVYSKVIRSTDIDINRHTNNLKYIYMTLDAFSVEELLKFDIKEFEIYFVNESYENDCINIFKKRKGNYFYIEGKRENKTIFKSVLKVKKKKES